MRGLLSVLREGLVEEDRSQNLLEYVNGFHRRLFMAGITSPKNLVGAESKMKRRFDKRAECRVFTPGDLVLALVPSPGSPFCA